MTDEQMLQLEAWWNTGAYEDYLECCYGETIADIFQMLLRWRMHQRLLNSYLVGYREVGVGMGR